MELVQMAREMGKALQSDERYIKMRIAKQACDEDLKLQEEIRLFNLKKAEINLEAQKEIRDEESLRALNLTFRQLYGKILGNESMKRYQMVQGAFEELYQEITGILKLCAEGEDPATCQPVSEGCGGDCGSCGGC